VTALIVANEFLEAQVRELQAAVSNGYIVRIIIDFNDSALVVRECSGRYQTPRRSRR
jgi:hypothetical protein